MSSNRSFQGFVESAAIQNAIDALIPWQVVVVVEGWTDWHWLQSKVKPQLAKIVYREGEDGGKDFVLKHVRSLRAKDQRAIGIVDRDFDGLLSSRREGNEDCIFDTEFHDSEMVMVDAGALQTRLENDLPPHERKRVGIDSEAMREMQSDALTAVTIVGAIRLVNLKRRQAWDRKNPWLNSIDAKVVVDHYTQVQNHRWTLNVTSFLQGIAREAGWTDAEGRAFAKEVVDARAEVLEFAKESMEEHGLAVDDLNAVERYAGLLVGNGHEFMLFITKAWVTSLESRRPPFAEIVRASESISSGLRDVFELVRFRKSVLFHKISSHCQARYGACIFLGP